MKRSSLKSLLGNRPAAVRLAIVLLIMVATILAGKQWEDVHVESLRKECGSLFRDRLIPAATLFHLNDRFYSKRATFEGFLAGQVEEPHKTIDYRLGQHDTAIIAAIEEIEKTYLVDEESRRLSELRARLADYSQLEAERLALHRKGENVNYDLPMRKAFGLVHDELLGLIKVQEEVGQQLNHDAIASAAQVTALLHLQLSITFLLGLIASALALGLTPTRPPSSRSSKDLH